MDVRIFICTHKRIYIPELSGKNEYYVLQCGNNNSPDFGYLRCNTGNNIANKNNFFCELVGHYWIWHNITCDIIGIFHYHRFLSYNGQILNRYLSEQLLLRSDVIVAPLATVAKPIGIYWSKFLGFDHLLSMTRNIIVALSPDYLSAYDAVTSYNHLYPRNMLVCKKALFDEYCSWLFLILNRLLEQLDPVTYRLNNPKFSPRYGGYIGEILLNVYLYKHNLSVLAVDIMDYSYTHFDSNC